MERLAELAAADAEVSAITGRSTQPWFRPPFGAWDDSVLRDVASAGYTASIMWTVDSLALPDVIDGLRAAGYAFVTIPQLLA